MNVAEYIVNAAVEHGIRTCFAVPGGHAMFLNESAWSHPDLTVVSVLHEQTASMCADAYYRTSGRMAMVMVTAGPGVMNVLQGVAGAYLDAVPMLVLSGQIKSEDRPTERPRWAPMLPTIHIVEPITKWASTIRDTYTVKRLFEDAMYFATAGIPGPVWLDIPLDIQAAEL